MAIPHHEIRYLLLIYKWHPFSWTTAWVLVSLVFYPVGTRGSVWWPGHWSLSELLQGNPRSEQSMVSSFSPACSIQTFIKVLDNNRVINGHIWWAISQLFSSLLLCRMNAFGVGVMLLDGASWPTLLTIIIMKFKESSEQGRQVQIRKKKKNILSWRNRLSWARAIYFWTSVFVQINILWHMKG